MHRRLTIDIRRDTWPSNRVPRRLQAIHGTTDVDIIAFLLMTGYVTVPAHAARHSINAMWAWVRYFGALSTDPDFRVSEEFADLDPHQKTILSDDFGMGMSLHLIADVLGLVGFCDGRYFIDRLRTRVRCQIDATNAKNGSRKSPDFVGIDARGKWHVIECKGTQSGPRYGDDQLERGRLQKNAIRFQGTARGQSLVTGLRISSEEDPERSRFVVIDPESEVPPLEIEPDEVPLAAETVARGKIARSLMLAGAPNLSRIAAAPFGDDPSHRPETDIASRSSERASRMRGQGLSDIERMTRSSDGYLGREAELELPFIVRTEKGPMSKARVQSEVAHDVVEAWRDDVRGESSVSDELDPAQAGLARGKIESSTNATGGELKDGGLYRSRIEFIER